MRIGILGYSGRMGQLIAAEIASRTDCSLGGGLVRDHTNLPKLGYATLATRAEEVIAASDVVIDFTTADATAGFARLAAAAKRPFLSGTTSLSSKTIKTLEDVSSEIAVLHATNTSLSLIVMKQLTLLAARLLRGPEYNVAIIEEHHRNKKDAPSGTAISLGEAVKTGSAGESTPDYASLRIGGIVGEHEVIFAGQGETIRLHHSITDRRIFARGAVDASLWLKDRKPGFYRMEDVLKP